MSLGVWIFEEHDIWRTRKITLELLSEGRNIARRFKEELCVVVFGHDIQVDVSVFVEYGAEKVYVVDNEMLSTYDAELYSLALKELIEGYEPSMLLMGSTPMGAELAPRIAAQCGLPCITEANQIKGAKKNLKITKSVYNDKVYATVVSVSDSQKPLVITIPPGETDIVKSPVSEEMTCIKGDVLKAPG